MRRLLLVFSLLSFFYGWSQDSLSVTNKESSLDTVHSPKKAMLYSLVLPGAGQVYNHISMPKGKKKAFWKLPIIYAGLGITTYLAIQNNALRKDAKAEYSFRLENNNQVNDPQFQNFNLDGVLSSFNQSQRNRDLMVFGAIIVYGLNILDAGVEAHFVNFDVTDNLSLNVQPTLMDKYTLGMHLSFNFR